MIRVWILQTRSENGYGFRRPGLKNEWILEVSSVGNLILKALTIRVSDSQSALTWIRFHSPKRYLPPLQLFLTPIRFLPFKNSGEIFPHFGKNTRDNSTHEQHCKKCYTDGYFNEKFYQKTLNPLTKTMKTLSISKQMLIDESS